MSGELHLDDNKALELYQDSNSKELLDLAATERQTFSQNKVEFCAIVNAKSGKCSENCTFCAQSVHAKTDIAGSHLSDMKSILSYARMLEGYGVRRLSLVSSGKGLNNRDLEKYLPVYRMLKEKTRLSLCASHGIITLEQAKELKESGVTRYHHNLETGESYFPKVCTTHTYQERLATIRIAMDAGLEICSGGLIGLGELAQDRVELAFALKNLGVKSIPLNILMPVGGTPLANNKIVDASELLKTVALFRCINPAANIRFAGGRPLFDIRTQMQSLKYGFDALMVGDYLTRKGVKIEVDINNLRNNGFHVLK